MKTLAKRALREYKQTFEALRDPKERECMRAAYTEARMSLGIYDAVQYAKDALDKYRKAAV